MDALAYLGRMLRETPRNVGAVEGKTGIKGKPVLDDTPTLSDLGLDKKTSSLAQKIAGLTPEQLKAVRNERQSPAKVLKEYPDLRIELTSHTDTRGTAEYNMELSRKRSESSKAYLVLQGINANRITTLAAGETLPRNECTDDVPCTEEQHQYNRRTEVRIINPAAGMEVRYKSVQ